MKTYTKKDIVKLIDHTIYETRIALENHQWVKAWKLMTQIKLTKEWLRNNEI